MTIEDSDPLGLGITSARHVRTRSRLGRVGAHVEFDQLGQDQPRRDPGRGGAQRTRGHGTAIAHSDLMPIQPIAALMGFAVQCDFNDLVVHDYPPS